MNMNDEKELIYIWRSLQLFIFQNQFLTRQALRYKLQNRMIKKSQVFTKESDASSNKSSTPFHSNHYIVRKNRIEKCSNKQQEQTNCELTLKSNVFVQNNKKDEKTEVSPRANYRWVPTTSINHPQMQDYYSETVRRLEEDLRVASESIDKFEAHVCRNCSYDCGKNSEWKFGKYIRERGKEKDKQKYQKLSTTIHNHGQFQKEQIANAALQERNERILKDLLRRKESEVLEKEGQIKKMRSTISSYEDKQRRYKHDLDQKDVIIRNKDRQISLFKERERSHSVSCGNLNFVFKNAIVNQGQTNANINAFKAPVKVQRKVESSNKVQVTKQFQIQRSKNAVSSSLFSSVKSPNSHTKLSGRVISNISQYSKQAPYSLNISRVSQQSYKSNNSSSKNVDELQEDDRLIAKNNANTSGRVITHFQNPNNANIFSFAHVINGMSNKSSDNVPKFGYREPICPKPEIKNLNNDFVVKIEEPKEISKDKIQSTQTFNSARVNRSNLPTIQQYYQKYNKKTTVLPKQVENKPLEQIKYDKEEKKQCQIPKNYALVNQKKISIKTDEQYFQSNSTIKYGYHESFFTPPSNPPRLLQSSNSKLKNQAYNTTQKKKVRFYDQIGKTQGDTQKNDGNSLIIILDQKQTPKNNQQRQVKPILKHTPKVVLQAKIRQETRQKDYKIDSPINKVIESNKTYRSTSESDDELSDNLRNYSSWGWGDNRFSFVADFVRSDSQEDLRKLSEQKICQSGVQIKEAHRNVDPAFGGLSNLMSLVWKK